MIACINPTNPISLVIPVKRHSAKQTPLRFYFTLLIKWFGNSIKRDTKIAQLLLRPDHIYLQTALMTSSPCPRTSGWWKLPKQTVRGLINLKELLDGEKSNRTHRSDITVCTWNQTWHHVLSWWIMDIIIIATGYCHATLKLIVLKRFFNS